MKIVGESVRCSEVLESVGKQLLLVVDQTAGVHVKPVLVKDIKFFPEDNKFKLEHNLECVEVVLPDGSESVVKPADLRHFGC